MIVDMLDIDEFLRKNGYRATPQRRTIYDALKDPSLHHPTVAEVHRIAEEKDRSISLATVYKALQLFSQIGLISEMGFRDESTRYDAESEPHVHLVCTRCGKVEDYKGVNLDSIVSDIEKLKDFRVFSQRFELHGLCVECQRQVT